MCDYNYVTDVSNEYIMEDYSLVDFCRNHPTLETITQNLNCNDRKMPIKGFVNEVDPDSDDDDDQFAQLRPGLFRDLYLNLRDFDYWDSLFSFLRLVPSLPFINFTYRPH